MKKLIRFSSTHQPSRESRIESHKGKKYFKPLLKKFLKGEIQFISPLSGDYVEVPVGVAIAIQHVYDALQPDNISARKDLMDRVDDENITQKNLNMNMNVPDDDPGFRDAFFNLSTNGNGHKNGNGKKNGKSK